MRNRLILALLSAILAVSGCASSKVSSAPIATHVRQSVKVIAIAPGGGMMADAVGVELANRGFTIIDPSSTSNLMVRLNLNEIEITKPEGLEKLKNQGIDAFLIVRAGGGYDEPPKVPALE